MHHPGSRSFPDEDWLHFWETFSPYILRGNTLAEPYQEMCELLRDIVVWYFRAGSVDLGDPQLQYTQANRSLVQQKTWRLAQLFEQVRLSVLLSNGASLSAASSCKSIRYLQPPVWLAFYLI